MVLKCIIYSAKLFRVALCSLSFADSTAGGAKRPKLPHDSYCNSCSVISIHAINLPLYTMYTDTSLSGTWSTLQYFGSTVQVFVIHTLPQPSYQTALTLQKSDQSLWHWINSTVTQSCHPRNTRLKYNGVGVFAACKFNHIGVIFSLVKT